MRHMSANEFKDHCENDEIESVEANQDDDGKMTVIVNRRPLVSESFHLTTRRAPYEKNVKEARRFSDPTRMMKHIRKYFDGDVKLNFK